MAALLKTTEADPTVPAALRADHLSGFDKPARPRRTRPAPAAAQAEVETLLATDPDAAAAALARHVDRFAGNATFLLWASQTFSELAAARPFPRPARPHAGHRGLGRAVVHNGAAARRRPCSRSGCCWC